MRPWGSFVGSAPQIAPVDTVDDADRNDADNGGRDPAHDFRDDGFGAEYQLADQIQENFGAAGTDDLQKASAEEEYTDCQQNGQHDLGDKNTFGDAFGRKRTRHGGVQQKEKRADHREPPRKKSVKTDSAPIIAHFVGFGKAFLGRICAGRKFWLYAQFRGVFVCNMTKRIGYFCDKYLFFFGEKHDILMRE